MNTTTNNYNQNYNKMKNNPNKNNNELNDRSLAKSLMGIALTILLLLSAVPFTAAGNVSVYAYWVGVNKLTHTVTQGDLPQIMVTGDSLAPSANIYVNLFKVISGSSTQKVSTLLKIENYSQDSFTKMLTLNTNDLLGDYTVNVSVKSAAASDVVLLTLHVNPKQPEEPTEPQTPPPEEPPEEPINHPPILNPIGDKYVEAGQTLNFAISAADADGDKLEYGAKSFFPNMVLNSGSGKFTWTPYKTDKYVITFTVSDGKAEDTETITIFVSAAEKPEYNPPAQLPQNTAPVMKTIPPLHVNEGDSIAYKVSATDAEKDKLTFIVQTLQTSENNPNNSFTNGVPAGAKFDLQTGVFQFSPSFEFVQHPHQKRSILLRFRAYDGKLFSEWKLAAILVNDINQVPVFSEIPDELAYVGNTISFGLQAKDADKEDVLSYKIATVSPATTSAADLAENKFSWTPKYHDLGLHTFTFSVSDGFAAVEQEMKISVILSPETKVPPPPPQPPPPPPAELNSPPTFSFVHTQFGKEGQLLEFAIKVSDKNGDKITLTPYSADAILPDLAPIKGKGVNIIDHNNGEFTVQLKPLFTFVKHPQKNRVFTLILEASDGQAKEVKKVNILIEDANQLPQFAPITDKVVFVGESAAFAVNAHDADKEDTLNYDVKNLPAGAKFNKSGFAWTPTKEQVGKYSVTFTVNDGIDLVSKKVMISVMLKNDTPVIPSLPEPPVVPEEPKQEEPLTPPSANPPSEPPVSPPTPTPVPVPVPPPVIIPPAAVPPQTALPENLPKEDFDFENVFIKSVLIVYNNDNYNNQSADNYDELKLAQAFISVRNESGVKAENLRAVIMIPELGIVQSIKKFDLGKNKDAKISTILFIPPQTPSGTYLVKVLVKNDSLRTVAYRQLNI